MHGDVWAAAVSAALDDAALAAAADRVTAPIAGVERRSLPLTRAQLLGWAAAAASRHPDLPPSVALRHELAADARSAEPTPLPTPPQPDIPRHASPGGSPRTARDLDFPARSSAQGVSR